MVAGEGPAKEPKRRVKMDVMVGELEGETCRGEIERGLTVNRARDCCD